VSEKEPPLIEIRVLPESVEVRVTTKPPYWLEPTIKAISEMLSHILSLSAEEMKVKA
jgi:hypothetical protein